MIGLIVVGIEITEAVTSSAVMLTKEQAKIFVQQIMEMCEDD
jgi:hypothetical protein